MSNSSDKFLQAAIGSESLSTQWKLKRRTVTKCIGFGAGVTLSSAAIWIACLSPTSVSLLSNYVSGDQPKIWEIKCRHSDWRGDEAASCGDREFPHLYVAKKIGGYSEGSPKAKLISKEVYTDLVESSIIPNLYPFWSISPIKLFDFVFAGILPLLFGISAFGAYTFLTNFGANEQKSKRIDGALDLVDAKKLNQMVIDTDGGVSGWSIADVVLPKKSLEQGVLVIGAQGVGKSVLINDIFRQAKEKKVRKIINDPKGEFYKAHFRPGVDVFFNPALEGTLEWSIFSELRTDYDAEVIGAGFIPKRESKGNGDFWDDAARSVFVWILHKLAESGERRTSEIAKAFFQLTAEQLEILLAGTPAGLVISKDAAAMRAGVMASAAVHMSGLGMMDHDSWSVKDWLEQDQGDIYLVGDEARFRAAKRLLITTVFEQIKERGEVNHQTKYWFVLDEYPVLGDVDIDARLAALRSYGVSILVALQAATQADSMMGKERAATLFNVLGTTVQLKINGADACKKASELFGEQLVEEYSFNHTLAVEESRDGMGFAKPKQIRPLIMAPRFGMLEDLTGFMKFSGALPAARINFKNWFDEGSSKTGGARALENGKAIHVYPSKDPKFNLRITNSDWRKELEIARLESRIVKIEEHLPNLVQPAAIQKWQAQLAMVKRKLAALKGLVDSDTGEIYCDEEDESGDIEIEAAIDYDVSKNDSDSDDFFDGLPN